MIPFLPNNGFIELNFNKGGHHETKQLSDTFFGLVSFSHHFLQIVKDCSFKGSFFFGLGREGRRLQVYEFLVFSAVSMDPVNLIGV